MIQNVREITRESNNFSLYISIACAKYCKKIKQTHHETQDTLVVCESSRITSEEKEAKGA